MCRTAEYEDHRMKSFLTLEDIGHILKKKYIPSGLDKNWTFFKERLDYLKKEKEEPDDPGQIVNICQCLLEGEKNKKEVLMAMVRVFTDPKTNLEITYLENGMPEINFPNCGKCDHIRDWQELFLKYGP